MSEEPLHRALGLTDQEYQRITGLLGRDPSREELAMYSVMWSEHCSYKSSRAFLGRFPSQAPWVVVGPGENAGVVDIGDGWLAALRIESHNHPSFVEPYQGAATGVGGILRDIFTMGARPIALWDSLRFGPLDDPRNRYLFEGVVAGIAGYGNAVGVPTVGGELEIDQAYSSNPLVNVMALGLMRRDRLVLGRASGEGNLAVLLGASTGRDGIGGVSVLASAGFEAEEHSKRPSVQVGDPFQEKKLIEACLELYERDLVVGIQDLGGAGLTCATSETAARAGMGMEVDLDALHLREEGMEPAEILLSESQERMLAIVRPEDLEEVLRLAEKWEIHASPVGRVVSGDRLRVCWRDEVVADCPAVSLTAGAPRYERPARMPTGLAERWEMALPEPGDDLLGDLITLLSQPDIGDPGWIYQQYDHMLFLNTVVPPGHDGSLLRVKGTRKGLAVSVDGAGFRCSLDPRRGAARLVFEAALNVAVTGARPLAVVDNLNFGDPERPEVMWQFIETVEGIAEACEALGIPVVGGNVSFYNETGGSAIHPTPVIGMLGLADPMPDRPTRLDRARAGMELWLFGPAGSGDLAGSAYAGAVLGHRHGRPAPSSAAEAAGVIELAVTMAREGLAAVLHDVSKGGLAVALAEIMIHSAVGATVEIGPVEAWFGEDPHRLLAALSPDQVGEALDTAARLGAATRRLGTIEGTRLTTEKGSMTLDALTATWRSAIPRALATQT